MKKDYYPFIGFIGVIAMFAAVMLNERTVTLTDRPAPSLEYAYPAEPVLVNFFASWCAPCRVEHEVIAELAAKHGLKIYGVAYKDKRPDLEKYLADLGNPYDQIVMDEAGGVFIDWGLSGVPESFLVHEGRIRLHIQGPIMAHDVAEKILPAIRKLKP